MKFLLLSLCLAVTTAIYAERPGERRYQETKGPDSLTWTAEYGENTTGPYLFLSFARYAKLDQREICSIHIHPSEASAVTRMLEKSAQWAEAARKDKAPDFQKHIATFSERHWYAVYSAAASSLVLQVPGSLRERISEQDARIYRALLLHLPEMIAEYRQAQEASRDYASRLK